jgi:hypothetical protein
MWRDLLMPFAEVNRPQGTVPCLEFHDRIILSLTPEVFDTRALSATADQSSQAQVLKLKSAHIRTLL